MTLQGVAGRGRDVTRKGYAVRIYVRMYIYLASLHREERGATAVEYGMLVALIAAVLVGVVTALGLKVQRAFEIITDALPT